MPYQNKHTLEITVILENPNDESEWEHWNLSFVAQNLNREYDGEAKMTVTHYGHGSHGMYFKFYIPISGDAHAMEEMFRVGAYFGWWPHPMRWGKKIRRNVLPKDITTGNSRFGVRVL